ncbi:pyridoxamine 5'-phosphate oxidase [Nitriliruptoraceae bacterium ZYF776]|nr:pyridoxamine 5'-phosphate oxidase [Profundirhabdus halotolerans]
MPQPRADYVRGALRRADVDPEDPLAEVRAWVAEAVAAAVAEPTAAVLSTVDEAGRPDARVVLVRDVDARGAVWFSNHRSTKGRQLATSPVAALTWFWPSMERQIRLRGEVEHLETAASDAYWAGRPRGSQLASAASEQSAVVADRATLEARFEEVAAAHAGGAAVPRPSHWGGRRLVPVEVELWQGRPARLHDRLRWRRATGGWVLERLMP